MGGAESPGATSADVLKVYKPYVFGIMMLQLFQKRLFSCNSESPESPDKAVSLMLKITKKILVRHAERFGKCLQVFVNLHWCNQFLKKR